MASRPQRVEPQKPVVSEQPKPLTPVRLTAPYSYYEDDGTAKNWEEGQLITDPAEIKHLIDRGVHLMPHEVES